VRLAKRARGRQSEKESEYEREGNWEPVGIQLGSDGGDSEERE